ncbi:hypothetical protein L21SP5_01399 [Salinivirga cyanobacteriivorans]|uniref:Uncharacterized protein n=2 Tax=Salinivirga cyanobacteriivorans TaxID=1307839 RepID=A0A0S2HY58_9BACT|nr:hypothetical protein L21SP5_01399 [Salinivirga cyanobacteriivorans]
MKIEILIMKILKSTIQILLLTMFTSCMPSNYYQMCTTTSDDVNKKNSNLVYENPDVRITYNLWSEHGNSSFWVHNKSNTDVLIDLNRSHLIINGVAHTYFQSRIFTTIDESSISAGQVSGLANRYSKSELSIKHTEEKIEQEQVRIPPGAAKKVTGFSIMKNIYRDCDLIRITDRKENSMKKFTKDASPLVFSNLITYRRENNDAVLQKIEHEFYISQIINYPAGSFIDTRPIEFCGEKNSETVEEYYKFRDPASFFIKYTNDNGFRH